MDFIRKLGKGEVKVEGGEVRREGEEGAWAEEFAQKREGEEEEEMGFWGRLEKEWADLAA